MCQPLGLLSWLPRFTRCTVRWPASPPEPTKRLVCDQTAGGQRSQDSQPGRPGPKAYASSLQPSSLLHSGSQAGVILSVLRGAVPQCLEVFLISTMGEGRQSQWAETGLGAKHATQQRIIWARISTVLLLKSPALAFIKICLILI